MDYQNLIPVYGVIQSISPFNRNCCSHMISLTTAEGTINFILSPNTYVVDSTRFRVGMRVAAFYDSMAPVPLIFPPQYQAVIMTAVMPGDQVAIQYFDERRVAVDQSLQINIGRGTSIVTANGQTFECNVGGNLLMVYYQTTTRSIPPQTTPRRIIVLCDRE